MQGLQLTVPMNPVQHKSNTVDSPTCLCSSPLIQVFNHKWWLQLCRNDIVALQPKVSQNFLVLFQHKFKMSLYSSFYFSHDCFFFSLHLLTIAITRLAPNQCNKNRSLLSPSPKCTTMELPLMKTFVTYNALVFSIQALLFYFSGINLSDIFPYSFMQTKLTSLKIFKLFFIFNKQKFSSQ